VILFESQKKDAKASNIDSLEIMRKTEEESSLWLADSKVALHFRIIEKITGSQDDS